MIKKQHPVQNEEVILRNQSYSSQHYLSIAEAIFKRYDHLLRKTRRALGLNPTGMCVPKGLENKDEREYAVYLNTWVEAEIKKKNST